MVNFSCQLSWISRDMPKSGKALFLCFCEEISVGGSGLNRGDIPSISPLSSILSSRDIDRTKRWREDVSKTFGPRGGSDDRLVPPQLLCIFGCLGSKLRSSGLSRKYVSNAAISSSPSAAIWRLQPIWGFLNLLHSLEKIESILLYFLLINLELKFILYL